MDFIKNFTKAIESLADFQPHMFNGATEKELFALEEKLGLTLPSDFKVFYQTYNGQDDCADYLFDFFSLSRSTTTCSTCRTTSTRCASSLYARNSARRAPCSTVIILKTTTLDGAPIPPPTQRNTRNYTKAHTRCTSVRSTATTTAARNTPSPSASRRHGTEAPGR